MRSCPRCESQIGDTAVACSCGWRERGKPQHQATTVLGYVQCEWRDGQTQCRYPGSMTTNTGVGGPWYCRPHFDCKDAMMGASIVSASMDYSHKPAGRTPEDTERAKAYCESLGLFTVDQKRSWLRANIGKIGHRGA